MTYVPMPTVDDDPVLGQVDAEKLNHLDNGILLAHRPTIATAEELPAAPTQGDLAWLTIDVATIVSPDPSWLCRYRGTGWGPGGIGAYPWEVIGAPPITQHDATTRTPPAAWGDDAAGGVTIGPTMQLPRAGVYLVEFGCLASLTGGSLMEAWMTVAGPNRAASDADAAKLVATPGGAGAGAMQASITRRVAMVFNQVGAVTAKYRRGANAGVTVSNCWISLRPLKVV